MLVHNSSKYYSSILYFSRVLHRLPIYCFISKAAFFSNDYPSSALLIHNFSRYYPSHLYHSQGMCTLPIYLLCYYMHLYTYCILGQTYIHINTAKVTHTYSHTYPSAILPTYQSGFSSFTLDYHLFSLSKCHPQILSFHLLEFLNAVYLHTQQSTFQFTHTFTYFMFYLSYIATNFCNYLLDVSLMPLTDLAVTN